MNLVCTVSTTKGTDPPNVDIHWRSVFLKSMWVHQSQDKLINTAVNYLSDHGLMFMLESTLA